MEDPRSKIEGVFPPNIARPLHDVKLLGGPASMDFDFSSELVMKRVAKLYFSMRTCSLRVFEMAQRSFDAALRFGKEVDIGLDGGRDKPLCTIYMLLYSWDEGLDLCVDLTCSLPLTQTGLADFVPHRAVSDVAH
ncbi:hypothetical protein Tco_1469841, partial [Tanacetum coccineum]